MKLEQAIKEQANIRCASEQEKADVINMLRLNEIVNINESSTADINGMDIVFFKNGFYVVDTIEDELVNLPASDFIASNDPHTF